MALPATDDEDEKGAAKVYTYDDNGEGDGVNYDVTKPIRKMVAYMKNDGSSADSEEEADWSYTHEFDREGNITVQYRTQYPTEDDKRLAEEYERNRDGYDDDDEEE